MSEEFWKKMDENPQGVYLVKVYNGMDREYTAIFSTKDKAQAYMDKYDSFCIDSNGAQVQAMCASYAIAKTFVEILNESRCPQDIL